MIKEAAVEAVISCGPTFFRGAKGDFTLPSGAELASARESSLWRGEGEAVLIHYRLSPHTSGSS